MTSYNPIKYFSKDFTVILFLLFLSALFRINNLSNIPPGIYGDEAEFGLINNRILAGGYQNIFSIVDPGIFSFPVISFIPQAWIYNIFGKTLFGLRLSSALIGTIAVVPFYLLIKLILDKKTAFFSATLMATSSLLVSYSRLAVNNIYPPFLLVLTLYFLFLGIKKQQNIFFAISGLIMGIGLYSYHPFKIVPLIIFCPLLIKVFDRDFRKKYLMGFILLFTVAFFVFLPQTIYYFSHPKDLLTRPANILIVKSLSISEILQNKNKFFSNVVSNILVFPLGKDNGYYVYGITKFGLFSPFVVILALMGTVGAFRKIKDYRWQAILSGIFLTIIATSMTVACPASHRLLVATPLMLILSGYGLCLITNRVPKSLITPVIIILLAINSSWDYYVYFKYYINSDDGWAQREPATAVAEYLRSLGPSYYTYMLREGTVLYFNHGTIKFLNPGIRGEDVEVSSKVVPLTEIKNQRVVFIMPPNSPSLKKLQEYYPLGFEKDFINPRNQKPWFVSYEVSLF